MCHVKFDVGYLCIHIVNRTYVDNNPKRYHPWLWLLYHTHKVMSSNWRSRTPRATRGKQVAWLSAFLLLLSEELPGCKAHTQMWIIYIYIFIQIHDQKIHISIRQIDMNLHESSKNEWITQEMSCTKLKSMGLKSSLNKFVHRQPWLTPPDFDCFEVYQHPAKACQGVSWKPLTSRVLSLEPHVKSCRAGILIERVVVIILQ